MMHEMGDRMRRVSRSIVLAAVVLLVGSFSAAAAGPNLVKNGDFTKGVQGNGVPIGWSVSVPTHFTRSDSLFETGPASGRIQGTARGRVIAWQRTQKISGGSDYQVSSALYVDTVDTQFQVLFQIRWFNVRAHELLQTDTIVTLMSPSSAFSSHASVFTAPSNATAASIRFVTIGLDGAVFVDTVVLQTVP
jgi:hypothetical protein